MKLIQSVASFIWTLVSNVAVFLFFCIVNMPKPVSNEPTEPVDKSFKDKLKLAELDYITNGWPSPGDGQKTHKTPFEKY